MRRVEKIVVHGIKPWGLPPGKLGRNISLACLTAITFIIFISGSSFYFIKQREQLALRQSLETVVGTTSQAISHWTRTQVQTAQTWASNPAVQDSATSLLKISPQREILNQHPSQIVLRDLFAPIIEAHSFEGYFIVDHLGKNLASSRYANLSDLNLLLTKAPDVIDAAWQGLTRVTAPFLSEVPLPNEQGNLQSHRMTMFVVTPLRNKTGQVHALFMLRISPLHSYTTILTHGRLGKSGETYGIDKNGYLVSDVRYGSHLETLGLIQHGMSPLMNVRVLDPQRILQNDPLRTDEQDNLPLTYMAEQLIGQKKAGYQIDGYRDYRGVKVIGAWTWIEDLQIGVTTEISFDEAYAGLKLFTIFNLASCFTLILLTLFVTKFYLTARIQAELATKRAHQAMGADKLKTEFLSTMSHEVRTPMNGILGMLSLLRGGNLPDKARKQVDIAWQSAENLLRLLNDILDYSRLESGNVELECLSFSPHQIIEDVVSILEVDAQHRNVRLLQTIDPDTPQQFMGDVDRIRQVLTNLTHNAIKFTRDGDVTLSLEPCIIEPDQKTALHFSVVDTGIGIAKNAQKKIFARFQQEDLSTTRVFGGSGLGLSICQQLVDLMGGEIKVDSEQGKGSTFTFTVPAMNATIVPVAPKPVSEIIELASPRKILVVDDDPTSQIVISEFLKRFPVEIEIVTNGVDALQHANSKTYDVILMDIQIPEMDGVMTTRKIRSLNNMRASIPIIGLTANAMPDQISSYLAAGMSAVVTKPVRANALYQAIEKALGEAKAA